MTTDIRSAFALDVGVQNELLNLPSMRSSRESVAVAAWTLVGGQSMGNFERILSHARQLSAALLPVHKTWLLIGSPAWQPDTRIVRYRMLWNALEVEGYDVPEISRTDEVMVSADGKLRFFGAIEISPVSAAVITRLLWREPCCYLVLVPSQSEIHELLRQGWVGRISADGELAARCVLMGGLFCARYGQFDDPETGICALGSPALIKSLMASDQSRVSHME